MKKLTLFKLLGLFACSQAIGQTLQTSGWQWQNPLPTGGSIRYIHFQNEKLGWATTQEGALIRTSNGGASWTTTQMNLDGADSRAYAIKLFVNGNGLFITNAKAYTTTNRGENWTAAGAITGNIEGGFILNEQIAWAFSQASVSKSTNGGQNWIAVASSFIIPFQRIEKLFFVNPNIGWVVCYGGVIAKTTDGGSNWTTQNSGITNNLLDVFFLNENLGWACGEGGRIVKTTNGGTTWTTQTSGPTATCRAISFQNQNIGLAAGAGYMLKTTNGGASWNPTTVLGTSFGNFASLQWVSPTICMAGGGFGGGIFKSTDEGNVWQSSYTINSTSFNSVKAGNNLVGAVGAGERNAIRSTDNGANWEHFSLGNPQNDLAFAGSNLNNWISVGPGGAIQRSTNRGQNWTSIVSGTTQSLNSVSFVFSGQKGYAVGNGGIIRNSGDGGASWIGSTLVVPATSQNFNSVYAIDAQTAYAVGNAGIIYRTTNGGNTWVSISSGTTNNLLSVVFLNTNDGWVAGEGTFMKTTNGGSTWTPINPTGSTFSLSYTKVDFISQTHGGVFIPNTQAYYHTTNGGNTWTQRKMPSDINDFYFSDLNTVYAVGNSGTILKTTRAGAPCSLWTTIDGPDTISLCGTETKTLSAVVNETGSYQWFKDDASIAGATNQALTVLTPGDYHVRVTSAGCTSITHATHVQQVSVPAAPSISATGSTSFCSGQSITLNSGGGIPVIWFRDGNQLSSTPSSQWIANQPGNYTGRSISQGCSSAASNVVAVSLAPAPSITVQPSNQNISLGVNAHFQIQVLQSAATYQWQTDVTGTGFQNLNNVLQYSGVTTNSLRVANVGPANNNQPFRCIVQLGQCRDTSTVAMLSLVTNTKPESGHHLVLYPNPGYNELHINGLEIPGELECYDALGKLQYKASVLPDVPLNLHHLSDGVYHIKLLTGKDLFSFKWLKINK